MKKYNMYKNQKEKDHRTFIDFAKVYRKSSQDNLFQKNEYQSLCNSFVENVDENINEGIFFHEFEHKKQVF